MNAFDDSCQDADHSWHLRLFATALAGMSLGASAVASEPTLSAVEWLALADAAREQAETAFDPQQRAEQLVASAEMLSRAKGGVFLPGGAVAPLDYAAHLAEARAAAEAAGGREDLLDRLVRLPGIDRGREGGRQRIDRQQTNGDPIRIRFEGGEPAIVYARTQFPVPLRLVVRDEAGRILCDEERTRGRVLCQWRPRVQQRVTIDTIGFDTGSAGAISIFTN